MDQILAMRSLNNTVAELSTNDDLTIGHWGLQQ